MSARTLRHLALGMLLLGCDSGDESPGPDAGTLHEQDATSVDAQPSEDASLAPKSQASWLAHMREEEKLARDVYRALNEQSQAFGNIAASEQQHMDAVAVLLARYGLTDPVAGLADGQFATASFQELYAQLVAEGERSTVTALRVGASVEDLDLADLEEALSATSDADVRRLFENLAKGSRNHLRSFVSQLAVLGQTYAPQHIDAQTFQAIVDSPPETGPSF